MPSWNIQNCWTAELQLDLADDYCYVVMILCIIIIWPLCMHIALFIASHGVCIMSALHSNVLIAAHSSAQASSAQASSAHCACPVPAEQRKFDAQCVAHFSVCKHRARGDHVATTPRTVLPPLSWCDQKGGFLPHSMNRLQ